MNQSLAKVMLISAKPQLKAAEQMLKVKAEKSNKQNQLKGKSSIKQQLKLAKQAKLMTK